MSAFTQELTDASSVFDLFVAGDVTLGASALTTAQLSAGVAHGLSATPDFVLLTSSAAGAAAAEGIAWSANATTLTLSKVDSQAPATISYLAANLA